MKRILPPLGAKTAVQTAENKFLSFYVQKKSSILIIAYRVFAKDWDIV